jgi:hypothetical protein
MAEDIKGHLRSNGTFIRLSTLVLVISLLFFERTNESETFSAHVRLDVATSTVIMLRFCRLLVATVVFIRQRGAFADFLRLAKLPDRLKPAFGIAYTKSFLELRVALSSNNVSIQEL